MGIKHLPLEQSLQNMLPQNRQWCLPRVNAVNGEWHCMQALVELPATTLVDRLEHVRHACAKKPSEHIQ
jgi:hypothetical protein